MKSKASISSHPLHPILVNFPIAFFTGTLVVDLLTLTGLGHFLHTAIYLTVGGLVGGFVAAIPGVIDFIYTVPPRSSAKSRAAKHGITNGTVMLLFAGALYYRTNTEDPQVLVILLFEGIGMILLGFAGWMGGTLVYRNQIAVDQRYANAGRWKEIYADITDEKIILQRDEDLLLNQMILVFAGDYRIVVARTENGVVAFDDRCPHKGGSLAGGAMICGTVQCPWHGSQFDCATGSLRAGPAKEGIRVYPLKEEENRWIILMSGI